MWSLWLQFIRSVWSVYWVFWRPCFGPERPRWRSVGTSVFGLRGAVSSSPLALHRGYRGVADRQCNWAGYILSNRGSSATPLASACYRRESACVRGPACANPCRGKSGPDLRKPLGSTTGWLPMMSGRPTGDSGRTRTRRRESRLRKPAQAASPPPAGGSCPPASGSPVEGNCDRRPRARTPAVPAARDTAPISPAPAARPDSRAGQLHTRSP